jgi:RNase P subunit RPR2
MLISYGRYTNNYKLIRHSHGCNLFGIDILYIDRGAEKINYMSKKLPIRLAGMIWGKKRYYCVFCKNLVVGFKDRLSAQEYRISGACQECQDVLFKKTYKKIN